MKMLIVVGGFVFMLLLLASVMVEQNRYEFKSVTITTQWGSGRASQEICNYKIDKRTGKTELVSGGATCPR